MIGHRRERLLAAAAWGLLGALTTLGPALWMWGFTVDDAFIPVRYARHLAAGMGWRFNVSGPSTDGVTPLPWPILLVPFAHGDATSVLNRARCLGLLAWGATGVAFGGAVGKRSGLPAWARVAPLAVLGLSVPVAAYASCGLETPVATALATSSALATRRTWVAAVLAGLAAAFRPEMVVWACVFAAGLALANAERPLRVAAALLLGAAPFAVCALLRFACWGRATPLAVLAKPSDLQHGLAYAGASLVVTLTPVFALAPVAMRKTPAAAALGTAALAHLMAEAVAGGDWMPFARLMVPIVPACAWAGLLASERATRSSVAARSVGALTLGVVLYAKSHAVVDSARAVLGDRSMVIDSARHALNGTKRVAALDVGWVSAATESDIVDLAGLTDPEIALLPGGHTSKRVTTTQLLARGTDALVLFAPAGLSAGGLGDWAHAAYSRAVEARLARDPLTSERFHALYWLPLGRSGSGYVVLRAAGSDGPGSGASTGQSIED